MKKKIIGIFVMTLLIATALPSISGSITKKANFDDMQNYEFVPGEFIVKFKDSAISSLSVDKLNEKYQVSSIEKVFRNSENTQLENIYLLSISEDSDILSIVYDYSSNPDVEYAEPNYIVHLCGIPNDENFSSQWGLHNTGQTGGTPDADIDAPEAWDVETGSLNIVIAIIDTGVDYTHPDLADNMWINENEIPDNDIDDDSNGYIDDIRGWDFYYDNKDPLDGFGHGTLCAGIAAAETNNDIGIAGVCWNCKIMPVLVYNEYGQSTSSVIANGIKYASENGADVISMSFGMYTPSEFLEDAVDFAYGKGIILVAAAGNSDTSLEAYPAAYSNVIAVAATDSNDERGHFEGDDASNYGNWIDIAAPGVDIYSTMPTYQVTLNYAGLSQNYDNCNGTSMACPHVTGLASLLLSQDPSLSQEEARSIIRANVEPYDSDNYIGTGRINAYKALTRYNSQPDKPEKPSGKTSGKIDREYTFTTRTADPNGDRVSYQWDWDDGNFSEWLGPYDSGDTCAASYTWVEKGDYNITVMAKDVHGAESKWSDPLIITITKNKNRIINLNTLFLYFLQQSFPTLFPIPQHLLQRLGLQ